MINRHRLGIFAAALAAAWALAASAFGQDVTREEFDALEQRVCLLEVDCTVTDPDPGPGPDPAPVLDIQAILDMPAGSWLAYGAPWSDLDLDRDDVNCGAEVRKVLEAWVGAARDARYVWIWAGGGHADGCNNGLYRYDLLTGQAEIVVPHTELNLPLLRAYQFDAGGNPTDAWNEPAVVDPVDAWPACAGLDANCQDLSKEDRLANGPVVNQDFLARDLEGNWTVPVEQAYGAMIRPRSSHVYNNIVRDGESLILMIGHMYGSGKTADASVFLYHIPTGVISRAPDRVTSSGAMIGGYNVNLVAGDGTLRTFNASQVCEVDPVAGDYDCANNNVSDPALRINFSNAATVVWDESRGGYWAVDPQYSRVVFAAFDAAVGKWKHDPALTVSDPRLVKGSDNTPVAGNAGLCLVPTDQGTVPVVWAYGATLYRADGGVLTEITGQAGQPASVSSNILNKWFWNDDLGVCMGVTDWDRGVDVWKPDFSNWQQAGGGDPDPRPGPGDWPTFAGVEVRPVPQVLAAWDQPIERQPEAPDYDALCPGAWSELHYTSDADIAGSAAQMRGLGGNVRIYLHGAAAAYSGDIVFDKVQCAELVEVPEMGHEAALQGDVSLAKTAVGIIVRGIEFQGGNVKVACHQPTASCPAFAVLHGNRMGGAGLIGDSDPTLPTTYLELRANVLGPNVDWHGLYLERSIGTLVAMGNVFHGSGNAGHALKNLASFARIEGNVCSNVGIDGQPFQRNGRDVIGLFCLDHYACTDSIIRDNIILFRTSGNVATLLTLRGRNSWGNCGDGPRLADGRRALFPPESAAYLDEERWEEIALAAEDFALGYAAARANPELFTHLIKDNAFIVFEGKPGVTPRALTIHSMRPIADNTVEKDLKAQMAALIDFCNDQAAPYDDCWFANASPEVRYVHDHIEETRRQVMRSGNAKGRVEVPNSLPIRAPGNWVERTGVFWDPEQTFIACNGAGSECSRRDPYPMDVAPKPWDAVEAASPPRLLLHTAP